MKKSIHRLLTVFLVAMMVSSVALQVNAAEVGSSPSISPRVPANQTQLFFMNIIEVKSIKTTIGDPEKMFVPRNLPSNVTLYLGGCLNHDLNGYYIRSGIYYPSSGSEVYGICATTQNGDIISGSVKRENLAQAQTYYGIVRNLVSSGAVRNGSITVSYA